MVRVTSEPLLNRSNQSRSRFVTGGKKEALPVAERGVHVHRVNREDGVISWAMQGPNRPPVTLVLEPEVSRVQHSLARGLAKEEEHDGAGTVQGPEVVDEDGAVAELERELGTRLENGERWGKAFELAIFPVDEQVHRDFAHVDFHVRAPTEKLGKGTVIQTNHVI